MPVRRSGKDALQPVAPARWCPIWNGRNAGGARHAHRSGWLHHADGKSVLLTVVRRPADGGWGVPCVPRNSAPPWEPRNVDAVPCARWSDGQIGGLHHGNEKRACRLPGVLRPDRRGAPHARRIAVHAWACCPRSAACRSVSGIPRPVRCVRSPHGIGRIFLPMDGHRRSDRCWSVLSGKNRRRMRFLWADHGPYVLKVASLRRYNLLSRGFKYPEMRIGYVDKAAFWL